MPVGDACGASLAGRFGLNGVGGIGSTDSGEVPILACPGDVWCESRLDAFGTLTSALLPGFALPLAEVFEAALCLPP